MSFDKVANTNAKTAATARKPSRGAAAVEWADDRLGLAILAKKQLRKVFPDHWSFMLGEIALWSFVVLLLTGVFLTLWFKPSMAEVEYMGSYDQLRGIHMSEAYASTLDISFDVRVKATPVLGSYMSFFMFGGEFPGDDIIPRLYTVHVLLIPALLLALIGAHMLLLVYHKHTQWPGPGRTNDNVVGYPLLPVYMAKAGGFFFIVFGVTALMGGLLSINPVWKY